MTKTNTEVFHMTASTHKHCAKCGAEFKRSANDYTVNCPDCRGRKTSSAASFAAYADAYAAAGAARKRGYAARAAGDEEGYAKAVAEFRMWTERAARAR